MKIYLGYETALACLRTIDVIDPEQITLNRMSHQRPPSTNAIKKSLEWLIPTENEIHLLVPEARLRQKGSGAKFHVWTPGTHPSRFFRINEGVFVSSPETLFVQLAQKGDEVALCKLAFEFCGSYAIDQSSPFGFRSRPAITTVEKLTSFAKATGLGEKSHAIKALKFVRNNSASPMETRLALLLGLPATHGGYALGMPQMNGEVVAGKSTVDKLNHARYHCDLYWPKARVALEYNSSAFHLSEKKATYDSKRLNDLRTMDITVFTLTKNQAFSPREMDRIAAKLAKAMGKRLRHSCKDIEMRRLSLWQKLFSKEPWG